MRELVLSMNPTNHSVGLYYLSGLSVVVLSKKEGWLACASTVLLLLSCVWRALLSGAVEVEKDEKRSPKSRGLRRRSPLRADAEPWQAQRARTPSPQGSVQSRKEHANSLVSAHVDDYRSMLTNSTPTASKASSSKASSSSSSPAAPQFRPPPGLRPPADTPPPPCSVAEESRALLWRLRELAQDDSPHGSPDAKARKPAGKRLVAGVRETGRAVASGRAVAVMVARDLQRADGGELAEPKMRAVVQAAEEQGVPVLTGGLSRQELGETIAKDVQASVVGLLDVSGAEDVLGRLLASAGARPRLAQAA